MIKNLFKYLLTNYIKKTAYVVLAIMLLIMTLTAATAYQEGYQMPTQDQIDDYFKVKEEDDQAKPWMQFTPNMAGSSNAYVKELEKLNDFDVIPETEEEQSVIVVNPQDLLEQGNLVTSTQSFTQAYGQIPEVYFLPSADFE